VLLVIHWWLEAVQKL